MSDYIKREDAIKAACFEGKKILYWGEDIESGIRGIPSADVVEVVRCKFCKLAETVNCPMYKAHFGYTDEDYCSCGERKGGESDE